MEGRFTSVDFVIVVSWEMGGGSHHVIAPPAARSSETKKVSAFYSLLHFSWGPTMIENFVQDFSHN
jgi:hypothetical protein